MIKVYQHKVFNYYIIVMFNKVYGNKYRGFNLDYTPLHTSIDNIKVNYNLIVNVPDNIAKQVDYIRLSM